MSKIDKIIENGVKSLMIENLEEKAVSKNQQQFMGMVHAYKKGEMKDAPASVKKAAKGMTKKAAKDFASTKHKGLPTKVNEGNLREFELEIINKNGKRSVQKVHINPETTELFDIIANLKKSPNVKDVEIKGSVNEGVMSELDIELQDSRTFEEFLANVKSNPKFKSLSVDKPDVQEFLLDLKAMGMDRDPQIAKAVVAAESNVQNKILKQKAESGKVYHPLPSPYHTKLSSVAGAKRGTYRHGGRDYGVPEGTAIYSIKDGVVSEISFGGDKFKKYFEFNTNKQAVRDAFPNKKLQEFRRGTFAPIDLTANSLPTKQKNAWKSNDPVKNSTHFFGTGGNWIFIKHEDGIESRYMHLNTIDVKKGEKVKAGQKIGSSGNTGKSTGPHLHFEIRTGEEGSNKNEQKYLEFLENALIPGDRPLA